ncbi:Hypothetical predicted protein [Cloeon dipterum]|uniref:Uncharacterized protein n=1 Tax=Cloeon dipterum TaxID=197152 RepID=A0A8S1DBU8_9INSE|nr:Hypothetical predicted protein [Cloeon dipterum]
MLRAVILSVISVAISAETSIPYSRCQLSDKNPLNKVSVATCIADCLELDSNFARCSFNATTGKAIENYENFQIDGCPKCFLPLQSFAGYKAYVDILQKRSISICGKIINYAPKSLGAKYDGSSMVCGMILPNMKHWLPKDYNEVRCIIEGLPENIQTMGKLRVMVYKSECSKEFFFCSTDTPRSLRKSFLDAELNGNQTTAFINGTCAYFEFNMQEKKAMNVQLKIARCKEVAYMICEHDD